MENQVLLYHYFTNSLSSYWSVRDYFIHKLGFFMAYVIICVFFVTFIKLHCLLRNLQLYLILVSIKYAPFAIFIKV